MIKTLSATIPEQFITKVVGVSFTPNYPENIWSISKDPTMMKSFCSLEREPENEHDANSIRVDINGETVGRIPRLIAAIIAPRIDSGEIWRAQVSGIVVSPANANQPGLKIKMWRDNEIA